MYKIGCIIYSIICIYVQYALLYERCMFRFMSHAKHESSHAINL